MKFVCVIDGNHSDIEDLKGTEISTTLESETPSELIKALGFINGTSNGVPKLNDLLIHLFEKKCAYAGRNYTIFIK